MTPALRASSSARRRLASASDITRKPSSAVPWTTATSSSASHSPDRKRSKMRPTPSMPKGSSSAARKAPMLAPPTTRTPLDRANRISLWRTGGVRSNRPSTIAITLGGRELTSAYIAAPDRRHVQRGVEDAAGLGDGKAGPEKDDRAGRCRRVTCLECGSVGQ